MGKTIGNRLCVAKPCFTCGKQVWYYSGKKRLSPSYVMKWRKFRPEIKNKRFVERWKCECGNSWYQRFS